MLSLLLLAGTMPLADAGQPGGEAHVLRREPGDVVEVRDGLGRTGLLPSVTRTCRLSPAGATRRFGRASDWTLFSTALAT
jgi:hypothetical protein